MEARKSSKNLNSIEIVIKVLGSLFCFALILMFSTSILPCVVRIIQLFTSNLSKSYIFLLCNGILVFIVKNSGSVADSFEENLMKSSGVSPQKLELPEEMKVEVAEGVVVMEIKELELTKDATVVMVEQEQEEEQQQQEEEEQEEEQEQQDADDDDDDEDEEMSREELNKKCEDFIRKMKQNIKLESQQLRCYYA